MNNEKITTNSTNAAECPPPTITGAYTPETKQGSKSRYKFGRFYCSLEDFAEYVRLRTEDGTLYDYAYILHDCDLYDEDHPDIAYWLDPSRTVLKGDRKKPHIHALFYWESNVHDGGRIKNFNSCGFKQDDGNDAICMFMATPRNKQSAYDYLLHRNAPTKYQYHESCLRQSLNAPKRFHVCENNVDENVCYLAFNDFVYGERKLDDMVKTYGKDFLYHYRSFKEIRKDIDRSKDVDYLNERLKNLYSENAKLTKRIDKLNVHNEQIKLKLHRLETALKTLKDADEDAYDCLCMFMGGDLV